MLSHSVANGRMIHELSEQFVDLRLYGTPIPEPNLTRPPQLIGWRIAIINRTITGRVWRL